MVVLSNFSAPEEGIIHEEPNTTLYTKKNRVMKEIGTGTLYITVSVLSWVDSATQQGFSLEYPAIALHATAEKDQVIHRDCLYIHINAGIDLPGEVQQSDENNSEDDDDNESVSALTEFMFAPANSSSLQDMFAAMNTCQSLHPDKDGDSIDGDEDHFEDCDDDDYLEFHDIGAGDASHIPPPEQMMGIQNGNEYHEAMEQESGKFSDAETDS